MSGLILKLGPYERVLVNGAVIQNGDRRSKISIVTPNANILRLRDAIRPTEADTPVRRVCYIVQLVLTGDLQSDSCVDKIQQGINQLEGVFGESSLSEHLSSARTALASQDFYRVLKSLRRLLDVESELLRAKT